MKIIEEISNHHMLDEFGSNTQKFQTNFQTLNLDYEHKNTSTTRRGDIYEILLPLGDDLSCFSYPFNFSPRPMAINVTDF